MALIFPRIAKNFIKNGYFPTDEPTLERIASALDVDGDDLRLLDPCCGEGAALSFLKTHLTGCGATPVAYGCDVDKERAWHAKTVLDTVAHADIHDVRITDRSMGLLFLNPPYGDLIADGAKTGDDKRGRERHEKVFCRRTFHLLQPGGVLVLIVPFYTLDAELSALIARHFDQVQVFMSAEQEFKQCVLFGRKRKPSTPNADLVARLVGFSKGEGHVELPEHWRGQPYAVPSVRPGEDFTFTVMRLDADQLGQELDKGLLRSSLWPKFGIVLNNRIAPPKPPLRSMTDWHLALALAAGQISGIVTSDQGMRLLIKGRTHKSKSTEVLREAGADGEVSETRVLTDKFVTVIKAIDLTPGPDRGRILTIC